MDNAEYEWWELAACLGAPDSIFFSNKDKRTETRTAKAMCAKCPVTAECLNAAMREEGQTYSQKKYRYGVRGGLTGRERMLLQKERTLSTGEN